MTLWFKWLRQNNPHYRNVNLQSELIDDFCQRSRNAADEFEANCQPNNSPSDEESETVEETLEN